MRFLFGVAVLSSVFWVRADDTSSTNGLAQITSLLRNASTGDADAEFELGKCYNHGKGVTQNGAEAVKWFEKAAEHGIVEAQMMVGIQYWNGVDVAMDEANGVKWFEKAADNAEPGAGEA